MKVEERIARIEALIEGQDKALELARKQLDAYKASANEWRQENMDQRRLFVTKDKADAMVFAVIGTIITIGTVIILAILYN